MSRLVHVNLLRDEERRGHTPIRARVMVPMFSILAFAGVVVWAGLSLLSNAMIASGNAHAEEQIAEQSQTVKRYEAAVARKAALEAENAQLDAFLAGRVLFGPALAAVAEAVPEDTALARLEIAYPSGLPGRLSLPKSGAKAAPSAPAAELRIQGTTTRPRDVEDLVAAIGDGAATNAFVSASVPAGSFRADIATPGSFRFEIVGAGVPRSFKPAPKPAAKRAPAGGGNQP
jgi:hypothetical protein